LPDVWALPLHPRKPGLITIVITVAFPIIVITVIIFLPVLVTTFAIGLRFERMRHRASLSAILCGARKSPASNNRNIRGEAQHGFARTASGSRTP
jgi:hypothetical protein